LIAKVLRNAASLASAQVVMKAAGLAVTILVARALHASGFGQFAATWSYGMLVGVLADAGLAYFVALEVSRVPRTARRFVWTALALRCIVCTTGLVIAAIALPFLHFSAVLAWAAMAFAFSAVLDGVQAQILSYYRAVARMHVEATIVTVGRVALLVTTLAALLVHRTVLAFALAQAAASLVTVIVAGAVMCRDVAPIRPRMRAVRAIAMGALPFAASGLLSYVFFRIDTLLLRAFGIADASIGAYSAAYRVMEAPRTAFGSIAAGVLPAATSLAHPRERAKFRQLGMTTTAIAMWVVLPAVLVFALSPGTVIGIIFGGHGFGAAAPLLLVLAPMPILMALDAVLGSLLNALGAQKAVTGVFAICAVANVALNVILIPRSGAMGAAIATLATEAVELSAFALLVQQRLGSVRPALGGMVIASVAGAGAGVLVPDGIARIVAAVGTFATVAFVLKRNARMATA
jgi:O-antigen/teichoic acid export membrane protein